MWRATAAPGYGLLTVGGEGARLETLQGATPTAVWDPASAGPRFAGGEALVVAVVAGGAGVRIVQQPRLENEFRAVIAIDGRDPKTAGPLVLALHRARWSKILGAFFVRGDLDALQKEAADAEEAERYAEALDRWEQIARRARSAELRLWALERFYDLHARVTFAPSEADLAAIRDAETKYPAADRIVGKYVTCVFWRDYACRAPVRRLAAQLDAVYSFLEDLTSEDTNKAWGRRLLVRYFTEHEGDGLSVYSGHALLVGGKTGELPVEKAWGAYSHELSHDFFHLHNIHPYPGFGEGWPDFARIYIFDRLGWTDWRDAFVEQYAQAFAAFRKGGRPLEELPGYGVNAGLLLEVLRASTGAPATGAAPFDWAPLRTWLHTLATSSYSPPTSDARPRHFLYWIEQTLGARARRHVQSLGFPVTAAELEAAAAELEEIERFRVGQQLSDTGRHVEAIAVFEELARRDSPFAGEATLKLVYCQDAAQQREGAFETSRRLGLIQDWLVVGPFPLTATAALDDVLPPEKTFRRDGTFGKHAGEERRWSPAAVTDIYGRLWFHPLWGELHPAVAYATTTLDCEHRCSIELRLQHDDHVKVSLDGKPILRVAQGGAGGWDAQRIKVELAPGRHQLLVKILNLEGWWGFSARLCGPNGIAVPGVTARPAPPR